jgi:endonuclease-3
MLKQQRVDYILQRLQELYPETPVPLVNQVTPRLFALADNPRDMAALEVKEIEDVIRPCGLSPQKSRAIKRLSEILIGEHDGEVPADIAALERLPGVGHKTASVVMAQAFGVPAFPVDTHIHRLAQRWGLTSGKNVAQTEKDLKRLFPEEHWNRLHLQIIFYGREHCTARGCDGRDCEICRTCYPDRKHPKKTRKA